MHGIEQFCPILKGCLVISIYQKVNNSLLKSFAVLKNTMLKIICKFDIFSQHKRCQQQVKDSEN